MCVFCARKLFCTSFVGSCLSVPLRLATQERKVVCIKLKIYLVSLPAFIVLQCFDAVGWAAGRASSL